MNDRDALAMLPLRPRDFAILLALAEQPLHGYGIMRRLSDQGEGWLLGPGTLYRLLKELQRDGLISRMPGPAGVSEGPPRRYYEITGLGRRVAAAEAGRMRGLVQRAAGLLPSE